MHVLVGGETAPGALSGPQMRPVILIPPSYAIRLIKSKSCILNRYTAGHFSPNGRYVLLTGHERGGALLFKFWGLAEGVRLGHYVRAAARRRPASAALP